MSDDKKDFKVNVNISTTNKTIHETGDIVSTNSTSPNDISTQFNNGLSLDNLHTVYVENGNSGDAAYQYLTNYLKENKDNPELIQNTVGSILSELGKNYDKTNVKHGEVGTNQSEYLSTVFSKGKGEEVSALICGTIHNFVRDALQDAGIEAVTVVGADTSDNEGFSNHACLMFKNNDGTYTFNNYGKSSTIQANNIKDAIYTVHKETGLLESGGQITIHDKNGSYQEFALSESSAYGKIIDKREYNFTTPTDNNIKGSPELNISVKESTTGDIKGSADFTIVSKTHNSISNTTIGLEVKKSNENAEFNESNSIGIEAESSGIKKVGNTTIYHTINGTYSHTTGTLGGETYTDSQGNTTEKNGGEISYETVMARGTIGAETEISNNGNVVISNEAGASAQVCAVFGHSNHFSTSGDGRITLEDGIKFDTKNFTGNISGGLVIDTEQNNNGMKPAFGGKLNVGANYTFKADDNITGTIGGQGYSVFTKTATETGFRGNIGASWTNPNSNSQIRNIFGQVNVEHEKQNLHISNVTETTENTISYGAEIGMNMKNNNSFSIGCNKSNNTLNPTGNYGEGYIRVRISF